MVLAQDPQGLLPLDQRKKIVCNRLTIKEVIHTKQEVPERETARKINTRHLLSHKNLFSKRDWRRCFAFPHWTEGTDAAVKSISGLSGVEGNKPPAKLTSL